jgi:hypothetical protein
MNWLRVYSSDGMFLNIVATLEFHIKEDIDGGRRLLEKDFILRVCFS